MGQGKFKPYKEQALKLYPTLSGNITSRSKQIADTLGFPYEEGFRVRLSEWIRKRQAKELNTSNYADSILDVLSADTTTETNQYSNEGANLPSAWSKEKGRFLTIEEFCDKYGLDKSTVKSSKLVSHNMGHMTYNIAFTSIEEQLVHNIEDCVDEAVKKYLTFTETHKIEKPKNISPTFDRLVYTDVHIGMDVNGTGDPQYYGKWDEEELFKRLDLMIQHCLSYKTSDTIYIDELGDFLDGQDAQTTRRGHDLPQNMKTREAFDVAVKFKVYLADQLLQNGYAEIIMNNICNDNHAGNFGFFANQTVKGILENKYSGAVRVNNMKQFINHYSVGKHTFILTHGKDMSNLKFGFKPKLDAVQADKVDHYLKENKLYTGNFIELSKGDSHLFLMDYSTSTDFDYCNYPAFSPPSDWVKTNFSNTKSGFKFYSIQYDSNIKIGVPYYF